MAESEPIHIDPRVLVDVAGKHDEVAGLVDSARERGGDISAAVESLGAIMHEVKAAVGDLLLERDTALASHANQHRAASNELHKAVHVYTNEDEQNAQRIQDVQ
jgi:excreted virulence factor EspC (type VII ESX diderm)